MKPGDPRNLPPFLQLVEQTAFARRSGGGGGRGLMLGRTLSKRRESLQMTYGIDEGRHIFWRNVCWGVVCLRWDLVIFPGDLSRRLGGFKVRHGLSAPNYLCGYFTGTGSVFGEVSRRTGGRVRGLWKVDTATINVWIAVVIDRREVLHVVRVLLVLRCLRLRFFLRRSYLLSVLTIGIFGARLTRPHDERRSKVWLRGSGGEHRVLLP